MGAGRKADPNSKRQKALAAKAVKAVQAPEKKPAAKKKAAGRGYTLPNGQKAPDAPPGWPFGTTPPEQPATAPPAATPGPDADDGLTDAQRANLTPLEYLLAVMRSPKASKTARMTAAIQAAPYVHPKIAQKGKKETALDEARTKPSRFAPAAPPRLAAANGKKI